MNILRRYLLKQHLWPFVFALTALTSFELLRQIARRLQDLLGKGLPWWVILEFFALTIPFLIALTLSMAVLVAVLYTMSRLAGDYEITAMRAGGVSIGQIVFSDPGALDTHVVRIEWGDVEEDVIDPATSPLTAPEHTYADDGMYTITITVATWDHHGIVIHRRTSPNRIWIIPDPIGTDGVLIWPIKMIRSRPVGPVVTLGAIVPVVVGPIVPRLGRAVVVVEDVVVVDGVG